LVIWRFGDLVSWGAAAVIALCAMLALPEAQSPARPNILLITLDTTRADRIGAYGYKLAETPNLDGLAREGIRFADATTHSPLTAPAHAALFTGRYATRLGVKTNGSTALPESAETLAEALKGAGYRTAAFIGAFIVDRQYGFAQGFDLFDASFRDYRPEAKLRVERSADQVIAPALEWLQASAGAPFFGWVHFYDPHTPYAAPPPFGTRHGARPYDGEIAYVDDAIGKLLAALGREALERTLVVAVGDHGEMLGEHGEEEHGVFLYEASLHVPWIVRLPRAERAGTVVAEQVRSVDLMPTVLDLVGVRRAGRAAIDGESLAPVIRGRPRRDPPPSYADAHYPELNFGWSMLRSWRVGEWKYVDAPRPELYDLRVDRRELKNVTAQRSNVSARMAAELQDTWRSFGEAAESVAPQPDPETLARLRSLGYVGIATPRPGGHRGPDPKDKIQDLQRFRTLLTGATADLAAGRSDAAIAKLKGAVAINDRAYDVHVLLGDAWRQKGEFDKALGEYDAAALLNPEIVSPHLLAAEAYRAQGLSEKALERVEAAARIGPGSGEVAFARGRVMEGAGRIDEALAAYHRAVDVNPSDAPARARIVSIAMQRRDFDAAEAQLRALVKTDYQPARTHLALGAIAEARGDRATAASEYRKALELDPNLRPAREGLARVQR
jgi:arylsulfatase A-like enzyme/Tfp pilus assembly protein PilF